MTAAELLKTYFGYDSFRKGQEDIINVSDKTLIDMCAKTHEEHYFYMALCIKDKFFTRDEAIEYLVKETNLSEECVYSKREVWISDSEEKTHYQFFIVKYSRE